jgi:hypothetical protein
LINAPGDASQDIPQRTLTMERNFLFPEEVVSTDSQTNASETYSFSYSGGPFFQFNQLDIYVNPGLNANPFPDVSCIRTSDANLITQHLDGTTTLSNIQKIAADVDLDGFITENDRQMILDVALGQDPLGNVVERYTNSLQVGGTTYNNLTHIYPTTSGLSSLSEPFTPTYTYRFTDPNIPSGATTGKNFYSIRLGDIDGSCATYSGRQANENNDLKRYPLNQSVTLFPNPVNSFFSVQSTTSSITRVEISDLSGRTKLVNVSPENFKTITISGRKISSLPSGTYILNIILEDSTVITKKIVKK